MQEENLWGPNLLSRGCLTFRIQSQRQLGTKNEALENLQTCRRNSSKLESVAAVGPRNLLFSRNFLAASSSTLMAIMDSSDVDSVGWRFRSVGQLDADVVVEP